MATLNFWIKDGGIRTSVEGGKNGNCHAFTDNFLSSIDANYQRTAQNSEAELADSQQTAKVTTANQ